MFETISVQPNVVHQKKSFKQPFVDRNILPESISVKIMEADNMSSLVPQQLETETLNTTQPKKAKKTVLSKQEKEAAKLQKAEITKAEKVAAKEAVKQAKAAMKEALKKAKEE